MDPSTHSDLHISQRPSPSQMITPAKSNSRGLLAEWPPFSDMFTQAPASHDSGRPHQRGNCTGEAPSGTAYARGALQKTNHLPTPQSPGNMASYLLTRTPSSMQELQPNIDLSVLPTEFGSYASPSPPPFRPHLIPTPESSPLVTRPRNNGPHVLAASSTNEKGSSISAKRDDLRSRASTPPRTPSRQTSTRSVTPVSYSRPSTPTQRRPTNDLSHKPFDGSTLRSNHSINVLPQGVKDESGGEVADIPTRLIENYFAFAQTAESHRPHSFQRARCSTPISNGGSGGGGASLTSTSELMDKDTSLLWSSVNMGIIDNSAKGKRTALFQETSEESFEECLMAGGYGRYRSDRAPWKIDEDADSPNQHGDAIGEDGPSSGMVLTEEEKRKKNRLAAFLDPPRSLPSVARLFPVEIEGRGRVLMKVEPPEPQTAPKPTPKTKRSRKRKKLSADMKQDMDRDNIAAPEDRTVDGPNWPDTEFPWRPHPMARDGLPSAEQEERLRCIENFLDRDSDSDDAEERRSSSRYSLDEVSRSGGGKMYPLITHSKGRRRGSTILSVVSSDPADAKTALLSKKSIRAVQLRLLRRRAADRSASDDDETLCICRGWDDGRPLVQCDACQTWYHLECIGIQSASELGREEDPWFCANCTEVKTPPPVLADLSEPTFVPSDDGEHGVGHRSADLEGYDPPFLNAGLNPSPATPWTRSVGPPKTPPRVQNATQASSGTSWEEAPSSSSRGGPRTPQFNTASVFGDMVRVYGAAPGRSLEPSSSTAVDDSPFDPTSTPSRGLKFGLPFATPKDGRWESSSWQGGRGSVHELLHTPKYLPEDASSRSGQPLHYHGRVEEISHEGPSRVQGLYRPGTNNVTPIERDGTVGPRWMQGLESPLGTKRPRRTADS